MGTLTSTKDRMKIVVGLDFSEMSDRALHVAVNMARSAGTAELHLVHVLAPPVGGTEFAPMVDVGEQTLTARTQLADLAESLTEAAPEILAFPHVLVGNPQREIPRIAEDVEADLVVVGTHGRRGINRALFGSVAEHVVRSCACSVLTVRAKAKTASESIEPPCPECAAIGGLSAGKEHRCARHTSHRPHAHTYSEFPPSFGLGSMTFRF
jgi:nucleotide-binding universal stress UspA family protein